MQVSAYKLHSRQLSDQPNPPDERGPTFQALGCFILCHGALQSELRLLRGFRCATQSLARDISTVPCRWLHRIYDAYVRWSRATRGSAIESHIYGPPQLLEKPDAVLLAQAIVDVGRAWPELKGHVIHSTLTRNEPTHTLLDVGRPEEHLGVTTPWPHLFCCGDWVRDRNPSMFLERASVTGIKAANAVLEDLDLEPWPLLTHPQPEAFAGMLELWTYNVRRNLRRRREAKQKQAARR